MLIAAYTGCGKTTAAEKLPNVVDLPSMPCRWLLPHRDLSRYTAAQLEQEKGALHRIADPRFPQNYILEILKAEQAGKTVLFPTIVPVINLLVDKYKWDVIVVSPEKGLKEEYRQRFLKRGNSDSFLYLFIDGWEERIEDIEKSRGRHLRLKSGEYLSSVLTEQSIRSDAAPVPEACLLELEREIGEKKLDPLLWIRDLGDGSVCPVGDLDSPTVRDTLEDIGKLAWQKELFPPRILSERLLRMYESEGGAMTRYQDLDEFYRALVKAPDRSRWPGLRALLFSDTCEDQ